MITPPTFRANINNLHPPVISQPHPRTMVNPQPVVTETIISTFPSESQQLKPPPLLKTNNVSADDRMPPILQQQLQQHPRQYHH